MDTEPEIELYWRPGCASCRSLRAAMQGTGLPVREVNIWRDRKAAARVREVAGGNETVPTVFVGSRALVNPTAAQVLAAVREHARRPAADEHTPQPAADEHAPQQPAAGGHAPQSAAVGGHAPQPATMAVPAGSWQPLLASAGFALLWLLLAVRSPDTTYHLAPLLVAGMGPVARRWLDRAPISSDQVATQLAVGSLAVALVTTAVLALLGKFSGPDVTGGDNALLETVLVALLGAALGRWFSCRGRNRQADDRSR